VSLLVLVLAQNPGVINLEGLLAQPGAYIQRGLNGVTGTLSNFWQAVTEIDRLRKENLNLHKDIDKLVEENTQLREAERQNEQLRQLLDWKKTHPSKTVIASVIGREPSNYLAFVTLDRGSDDRVAVGQVVVASSGLVGKVEKVGPSFCQVRLIVDTGSTVSGIIQSSRVEGSVVGQLGGQLMMKNILQGEKVAVGDLVITSGLGGGFPKGIIIGQVSEVHRSDVELFQTVTIKPAVDFTKLEEVLIITE